MNAFSYVRARDARGIGFEAYLDYLSKFVSNFSAEPENVGRQFSWRASFATIDYLTCWRLQGSHGYSMKLCYAAETLHISRPIIGAIAIAGADESGQAFPGSIFTYLASGPYQISTRGIHARTTLRFERPQLQRALSTFDDRFSIHELTPLMLHHLTETATQSLYYSTQAVTSALLDENLQQRSPVAMALLSESLLLLVLEKLTSGKLQDPSEPTTRHLTRAVDYMHSNIHQPLTMSDVAATAGISVRTLQSIFQAHYGATPTAYLRRIRLEAAHLELTSPDNILPVHEVALKWGFTHMGRFAETYRKTYGLLPSQAANFQTRKGRPAPD